MAGPAGVLESIERRVIACERCPELREYCARVAREKRRAYLDVEYWGKPVPAFGDPDARVLFVGLAPGAHGSNRTGRTFTGDASGDFLYPALYRAGFASQPNATGRDDGMHLHDCLISAAGRCAPPGNKPTPAQLRNCFSYLLEEFDALPGLRVGVGLGRIGYDAILKVLRERGFALDPPRPKFGHGVESVARRGDRSITAIGSYHPSRQNTNTGVLTAAMFDTVLLRTQALLDAATDEAKRAERALRRGRRGR
ncbi:MAG: uracil-DNA glycosylase [Vulcanimicrobiaceae bacterium]